MFLLIVKEDSVIINKCVHGIVTSLKKATHHIKVETRLITDENERDKITCDKVLLLLTARNDSLNTWGKAWVNKLPRIQAKKDNYVIVELDSDQSHAASGHSKTTKVTPKDLAETSFPDNGENKNSDRYAREALQRTEQNTAGNQPNKRNSNTDTMVTPETQSQDYNVIKISDFVKDVFVWWPRVLELVFGRQQFGGWFQDNHENGFRLYTVPNVVNNVKDYLEHRDETVKNTIKMFQKYGHFRVPITRKYTPCVLFCTHTETSLPADLTKNLNKKLAPVYTLALHGTACSREIKATSTKAFSTNNILDFIFCVMAGFRIINTSVRINTQTDCNLSTYHPAELQIMAVLAAIFTLPALVLQLAAAMVFLWPVCVTMATNADEKKVWYIHWGFTVVAIVAVIMTIITEHIWYPTASPVPVTVCVGVYLILWQIAVHWFLYLQYGYKYGIFSIPVKLFKKSERMNVSLN